MEELYIRINVSRSDVEANSIREQGLFFERIAEAVALSREDITEIDRTNFLLEIENIKSKYSDNNDKS